MVEPLAGIAAFFGELFSYMLNLNSILLIVVFFLFIGIAYKLFQLFIKAMIVGMIAAIFPVVAYFMGLGIPLTLQSVVLFAIFGVVSYMIYHTISTGIKVMRFILSPFRRMMGRSGEKEKIIIKEVEKKEDKPKK